jgi:polar amino acid transport system permease protein
VGEVFRAGIQGVHREQVEASRLDGASAAQSLRLVVLPQAIRAQNPNLLSNFVALQKDCGLISVLGAVDAVRAAQIESATSFTFTPYVVAGLLFVLLSVPSGRLADWLAQRDHPQGSAVVTGRRRGGAGSPAARPQPVPPPVAT